VLALSKENEKSRLTRRTKKPIIIVKFRKLKVSVVMMLGGLDLGSLPEAAYSFRAQSKEGSSLVPLRKHAQPTSGLAQIAIVSCRLIYDVKGNISLLTERLGKEGCLFNEQKRGQKKLLVLAKEIDETQMPLKKKTHNVLLPSYRVNLLKNLPHCCEVADTCY
jgi:hypothetical protein